MEGRQGYKVTGICVTWIIRPTGLMFNIYSCSGMPWKMKSLKWERTSEVNADTEIEILQYSIENNYYLENNNVIFVY